MFESFFSSGFDLSLSSYVLIFALIAFSGFVDSIAGGGGLISVPTYILAGVPAEFILGTNKTVSTTGGSIAVFRYARSGFVIWKTVIIAVLCALIGSSLGAQASHILSPKIMVYILLTIVPVVFLLNSRLKKMAELERKETSLKTAVLAAFMGLSIGFYDGFFGPGTGTFLILFYVLAFHYSLQEASINARLVNYASNFAAFFVFLSSGRIAWNVAAVGICASILGNFVGSRLVLSKADRIVRPLFNLVLVLLLVKCLYDLLK